MTDNKPINWAYPFKTAGEASKEVSDPQLYFDALATAGNGFYPMGANGLWHGGVHFDGNTGALLDQSQVRCIADGEVIAYRIDEKYPETPYTATIQPGMGPEPVGAKYSTGFVLVKHRLELPPAPSTPVDGTTTATTPAETTSPAAPAAEGEPASEGLTFYSLYMHLLDWASYQTTSAPKPPAFLAPNQYSVKHTSDDPLLGLRVRALPSGGTTQVLALLPKGCTVTLGEASSTSPHWKQLLSVDTGAAIPALPAGTTGWVYAPELTGNTVADKATDTESTLTLSHQGLNVRSAGNRNGAIIGVLPRGTTLKVGEKQSGGYCKVLEVMNYRGVPALPNGPDGKPLGYMYFDELEAQQSAPSDIGSVHLLSEPYSINAGELIGHIGLYQNQGEGGAKQRLHLEVFSCEDVPTFIAKSRTLAASVPAEQKTLLKIHKGASKLIPHNDAITASNPPKITDAGVTIAVELSIPVSVLESLPAERKIQVSETVPGSATPRITYWWRLDNLLADDAGNRISGWLAEQDLITSRHSPWEWEGFDFISETACAADHLACHLAAQRLLNEEEEPDYQGQISTADHGPIKARLYDIIDGADGSVRDDILSVTEIKAALSKPWHAQSISRLITHYESEWLWKDEKWDELDTLMQHTPEDPNPQWVKEKERIQKLCWWSEMAGKQGINADGKVWHFQPIGLISTLYTHTKLLVTKDQLAAIMLSAPEETIDKYLLPINHTLNIFEINTPLRIAHFLSQVGHETGELKFSEEQSSGTQYEGRASLGNNQPGDGPRFKGRGLLQVTGRANYSACEAYLKTLPEYAQLDITSSTEKAEQLSASPELAALASGYYWAELKPKLNTVSDADDLFWVSVYVNGWAVQANPFYPSRPKEPNNMHHRSTMLDRAKNVLGVTP